MQMTSSTRLSDLLNIYPELDQQLPSIHKRFQMLPSPIAKVRIKQATIAEMSRRSGMEESAMIEAINRLIQKTQ